jgi:hypothetical protein
MPCSLFVCDSKTLRAKGNTSAEHRCFGLVIVVPVATGTRPCALSHLTGTRIFIVENYALFSTYSLDEVSPKFNLLFTMSQFDWPITPKMNYGCSSK